MPLHRYRPLAYPCFKRCCAELAGLAWILFEQSQSLKHSLELILLSTMGGANLTSKQLLKGLSVCLKKWSMRTTLSKLFRFHKFQIYIYMRKSNLGTSFNPVQHVGQMENLPHHWKTIWEWTHHLSIIAPTLSCTSFDGHICLLIWQGQWCPRDLHT